MQSTDGPSQTFSLSVCISDNFFIIQFILICEIFISSVAATNINLLECDDLWSGKNVGAEFAERHVVSFLMLKLVS
jgi:hypothetical protein